jgi:hypothetical protein
MGLTDSSKPHKCTTIKKLVGVVFYNWFMTKQILRASELTEESELSDPET